MKLAWKEINNGEEESADAVRDGWRGPGIYEKGWMVFPP